MENKIDIATFVEIKEGQKDGINSKVIAKNMNLSLELVNIVYASKTYEVFSGKPKETSIVESKKKSDIEPLQKGYFRSLIERRKEQNAGLKEISDALAGTVKGLWGMIDLLQARKTQLETEIKFMENYMRRGSAIIENYIEDEEQGSEN